jgi:hypothetical protein
MDREASYVRLTERVAVTEKRVMGRLYRLRKMCAAVVLECACGGKQEALAAELRADLQLDDKADIRPLVFRYLSGELINSGVFEAIHLVFWRTIVRGDYPLHFLTWLERAYASYDSVDQKDDIRKGDIMPVRALLGEARLLFSEESAEGEAAFPRYEAARQVMLGFAAAPVWTTSPMPITELPSLLRIAESKGVEALHARHLGSRYRPGQRSPLWVRVPVPRIGRVLVGGWSPVDPRRPDRIASLLVGVPGVRGLRYVGRVGVSGDERRPVAGLRRHRRDDSPFEGAVPPDVARDAIWVEPRLVGLVDHTGFTADGRLRLPQWRGTAGAGSAAIPWARRADPPDDEASRQPVAESRKARARPGAGPRWAATTATGPAPVGRAPPARCASGPRRRLGPPRLLREIILTTRLEHICWKSVTLWR